MENEIILQRLKNLLSNKTNLTNYGPTSEKSQQWIADTIAALSKVDPDAASEFNQLAQYLPMHFPFSSYILLAPTYQKMLLILRQTISKLEISTPNKKEKIYAPGDQYELYKDLKKITSEAKSEVFIIDPYADEEIFELYFEKVKPKVVMRLLTKNPSQILKKVILKFAAKSSINFEARNSHHVHDRVIFIDNISCWVLGQSIKNAASKKPTYFIPIESITDMKNLYEDIWNKSAVIK